MSTQSYSIERENGVTAEVIEQLLDDAFGIERRVLTSYRLREGVAPLAELSLSAWAGGDLVGSLRFWPVLIDRTWDALLLGPLAVSPRIRGQGCGVALMETGLENAHALGHARVILVGDEPYYARAGFQRVPEGKLMMPGYVDPDRLLYKELVAGSMDDVRGLVGKAE
ncbi:MAG: GNAT family N-acetyltransferase [Hyphomicrobiales bacterium]